MGLHNRLPTERLHRRGSFEGGFLRQFSTGEIRLQSAGSRRIQGYQS